MGAQVKQLLTIGKSSIVGMGSVVQRDIPDEVIVLGNPARVLKRNEEKKVFNYKWRDKSNRPRNSS